MRLRGIFGSKRFDADVRDLGRNKMSHTLFFQGSSTRNGATKSVHASNTRLVYVKRRRGKETRSKQN